MATLDHSPEQLSSLDRLKAICRMTDGWRGRAIGFLFGALGVLGHAPLHLWPLGLLSFALLFWRLYHLGQSHAPAKAGYSVGFWHGLGYFGLGIFWVGSAFIARGSFFVFVMPFMVLAFAAVLAIFWGLAGRLFVLMRLKGISALVGFSAVMMLAELVRGHLWVGFPWNLPGYIFEAGSAPSQITAWINIYGLSWLTLVISAALGLIFMPRLRLSGIFIASVLTLGLYGYGAKRLTQADIKFVEKVNIRLVTVPFNQADKFDPDKSIDIVNQFITASLAPGIEDVTHLVWPEGAVNGLAIENMALLSTMGELLTYQDDTPPVWIMNSLREEIVPHPRGGEPISNYYNSSVAVIFDAAGFPAIAATNDKHHLVPFGEFYPFGKWLESYNVPIISTALASISPAPEKTLVDFPGLPRSSALICFEADFPGMTPHNDTRPARLIINQTNDAWYGNTWGPAQHANIARYRTIEEGLPMIRSASNGLSAVIDPYGRILASADNDVMSHIDTALPDSLQKYRKTTLVTFFIALLNLLITCIYLFIRRGMKLRRN